MGGPSSPDVAVAPPPAELASTRQQAPALDADSEPADAAAGKALVAEVQAVIGGQPKDALPPAINDGLASLAGVDRVSDQKVQEDIRASGERTVADDARRRGELPPAGTDGVDGKSPDNQETTTPVVETAETTDPQQAAGSEPAIDDTSGPDALGSKTVEAGDTTDTAEPVTEPTGNTESKTEDNSLPVADRLSSARSAKDLAQEALDNYKGSDLDEYRELNNEYRKAESTYRDTQAESDRALSEERLSSMEKRLTQAFEAKLTQAVEAIGLNNTEAFKTFKEYVDEKDKEKKEAKWQLVLVVLAAVGKELFSGVDVNEAVQQNQQRR